MIYDNLTELIIYYYAIRNLKWPNIDKALQWHDTEKGEACEVLLARDGGWVRNNPDDHPAFDKDKLAEELGDMVMMTIVAGLAEGVDVITALRQKIARKCAESTIQPGSIDIRAKG